MVRLIGDCCRNNGMLGRELTNPCSLNPPPNPHLLWLHLGHRFLERWHAGPGFWAYMGNQCWNILEYPNTQKNNFHLMGTFESIDPSLVSWDLGSRLSKIEIAPTTVSCNGSCVSRKLVLFCHQPTLIPGSIGASVGASVGASRGLARGDMVKRAFGSKLSLLVWVAQVSNIFSFDVEGFPDWIMIIIDTH